MQDESICLSGQPFGTRIMMKIVSLLTQRNIASLLWGNSRVDVYGVPTIAIVWLLLLLARIIADRRRT